jgi:hypothetical protein
MPRQPKEHCPVPEHALPMSLPTGGKLPELVPDDELDEELLVVPPPPQPPHPPQPVSLVVVVVLDVVAPPVPLDVVAVPLPGTHCAFSLQTKPSAQSRAESTQSFWQVPALQ